MQIKIDNKENQTKKFNLWNWLDWYANRNKIENKDAHIDDSVISDIFHKVGIESMVDIHKHKRIGDFVYNLRDL